MVTNQDFEPKPLHLHTLDSVCADLVSGLPIAVGSDGTLYSLPDDYTRSALQWYRKRGAANWSSSVTAQHGEQLVDSIFELPPILPTQPANAANANYRKLRLQKIEIHRFAGVHKFGTPANAPTNYVHEFSKPITLFEGFNGSGKTSIINAIIWALTGEILRSQREPDKAIEEFECSIVGIDESAEPTAHRLTPVTPLPDISQFRPDQPWVPADTWVELTFEDQTGKSLTPIRRSQSRTVLGKIAENVQGLENLQVDPISLRIGTLMPGLLPLIRVGSESELGKAVAQLTGLASLVDLADHARRTKSKIEKEFVKVKLQDIKSADESYERARKDLNDEIGSHPFMAPAIKLDPPSEDKSLENIIQEIKAHFENVQTTSLSSAQEILGNNFDPGDSNLRADLERNVSPAFSELKQLARLPSISRFGGLRKLTSAELLDTTIKLKQILTQAKVLQELSEKPNHAARTRLYALVALWISDHPEDPNKDNLCIICGSQLENVIDPILGGSVRQHINDAKKDAVLISQTLTKWSESTLNELSRNLPNSLQLELNGDLPDHPSDLIREGLIGELFATVPFTGVLAELKRTTASSFDAAVANSPDLAKAMDLTLPKACAKLEVGLKRLDRALRFSDWRKSNDAFSRSISEQVVGRVSDIGEVAGKGSLSAKLFALQSIVKGVEPITRALSACARAKVDLDKRRNAETRLSKYKIACKALSNLTLLGDLADSQVEELRLLLRVEAERWRNRIYLGALSSTAHELLDTRMSRSGELELMIGAAGVSAPAQHIANSSALRASLLGFFLAFWEYVQKNRGGLQLLLLDDPQELLDDENRERLADTFVDLLNANAQIIVTTYDPRFAGHLIRPADRDDIAHYSVHAATKYQPTLRTPLSHQNIAKLGKLFRSDPDAEEPARDYAAACRIFLESMLGDLFDDPAYSAWVQATPSPTLADYVNRIRGLTSSSPAGMFSAHIFADFVNHPGLDPSALTVKLLNKAHHGDRVSITPAEVGKCADQLSDLIKLTGKLHEECRRWRRRERAETVLAPSVVPITLSSIQVPNIQVQVCPDLAAFTQQKPIGQSQDINEQLDPNLFNSKALFYLRRDNFGFSAPKGAIAIVETNSLPLEDRRLVVAIHDSRIYARRLLRAASSTMIGLTAETPDPRRSPRTIFLAEHEVSLHQVVGVLFNRKIVMAPGNDEAVLIEDSGVLEGIEIAYRVTEDSAIPLALPKQIALGGRRVELNEFSKYEGDLVALTLEDGSSIFKRVSSTLPGKLSHVRQFESIGGLGSSEMLSVDKDQPGMRRIQHARLIVGVLYHG